MNQNAMRYSDLKPLLNIFKTKLTRFQLSLYYWY